MSDYDPILDVDQTARFLKKAKQTIYNDVHARRIPYLKVGGRVLFDRDEILEWARSHAVAPRTSRTAR